MLYLFSPWLLFVLSHLGLVNPTPPNPVPAVHEQLVWADEFDYAGIPDSTKWGHQMGKGCPDNCGWGNNELQYYTSRTQNAEVKDGMLTIMAQKENYSGSDYTSARLHSKGKFELTYGRVEVRAKIPGSVGSWPAIWMLGKNIDAVGWPRCGEIDIMEHRGYEPNKIFGTLHYPGRFGEHADGNTAIVPNAIGQFQIYSLEWTPTQITTLVNGKVIHSIANTADSPFHLPHYLLLNVAVGGNFAGPVDPAFASDSLVVDYVRVYK